MSRAQQMGEALRAGSPGAAAAIWRWREASPAVAAASQRARRRALRWDGVYAAIGRGLALLGHGIGRLLAIVLLTPLFWLVFVPFGRLLRGGRRDKLERWFDVAAPSYWHRREGRPRTKRSYERAF